MMKTLVGSLLALLLSVQARATPVVLEKCAFENGMLLIQSPAPGKISGEVRIGREVRLSSEVVEIRGWNQAEIDDLLRQTTAREVARHLGLDTRKIASARTYEINPAGNHDDASGALLVLFYGRIGEFLAKGAQIGWGTVRCRP